MQQTTFVLRRKNPFLGKYFMRHFFDNFGLAAPIFSLEKFFGKIGNCLSEKSLQKFCSGKTLQFLSSDVWLIAIGVSYHTSSRNHYFLTAKIIGGTDSSNDTSTKKSFWLEAFWRSVILTRDFGFGATIKNSNFRGRIFLQFFFRRKLYESEPIFQKVEIKDEIWTGFKRWKTKFSWFIFSSSSWFHFPIHHFSGGRKKSKNLLRSHSYAIKIWGWMFWRT